MHAVAYLVRWRSLLAKVVLFSALLLLSGCSQKPNIMTFDNAEREDVVWPAPPERSRFRYVGQLTGEENFSKNHNEVNFGVKVFRWVVGLVSGKAIPNILQRPQGGVVDELGRVFVTDVSRQAVCVFDVVTGEFLVWDRASELGSFHSPIGIVQGPNKELWVADSKLGAVVRLSAQGEPLGWVGEEELVHPTGITRDAWRGRVYVADTKTHEIKIFDDSGKFIRAIGTKGVGEGEFNAPTYLHFVEDELYVTDTLNSRIQVFDEAGKFVRSFGRRGLFIGDLPRPKGVTVDKNGLIYVVESFYDYLLVFNKKGELLMPVGGTGHGVGQFYLPAGVWTDNKNNVYVADMFNGRIVVLEFLGGGA
ncbi:hypothetical protein MNBD_GAMMA16-437 [hydrothermal vent metagenome]|uniref:NHL repeat domain protein n=1 Tax=hydrothermal vent metagenome TaxID=652676 RepID=A0A3B0Z2F0_9ZZZZ